MWDDGDGNGWEMGWGMDGGMDGSGWLLTTLAVVSLAILVTLLVLALVRGGSGSGPGSVTRGADVRQILDQRLARGEIDVDEYEQRLRALSAGQR